MGIAYDQQPRRIEPSKKCGDEADTYAEASGGAAHARGRGEASHRREGLALELPNEDVEEADGENEGPRPIRIVRGRPPSGVVLALRDCAGVLRPLPKDLQHLLDRMK
jgi:hypothetical protein